MGDMCKLGANDSRKASDKKLPTCRLRRGTSDGLLSIWAGAFIIHFSVSDYHKMGAVLLSHCFGLLQIERLLAKCQRRRLSVFALLFPLMC